MKEITHNPKEILPLVDDNDNVIGKEVRLVVHEKSLLHREVFVFIVNSKNEVLLQKRTDNHFWDASSGGHLSYGQKYEEAIVRECKEELGVDISLADLKELFYGKMTTKWPTFTNYRYAKVFIVRKDFDSFNPDPGEVEEIKFFTKEALMKLGDNEKTNTLRISIEFLSSEL